jgi:hypothetical protein
VADAAMARDADMGYPAVSSVASGDLLERHCRTREVMPTGDHQEATNPVSAHI